MQAYLSHSTLKSHQIYDWCETFTNKGINHQNNYNMNYFLPGNYQRCYVSTCWEMLKCISTSLRMNLLLDISLHSMNLFQLIPLQIISCSQFIGNLENHFMLNNYRGPSIAYSIFWWSWMDSQLAVQTEHGFSMHPTKHATLSSDLEAIWTHAFHFLRENHTVETLQLEWWWKGVKGCKEGGTVHSYKQNIHTKSKNIYKVFCHLVSRPSLKSEGCWMWEIIYILRDWYKLENNPYDIN